MIREATEQDIPRIVEMGSRSLIDGPYKGEIDNPEQSAKTALGVINSANGKVLVSENDDGYLTGLVGFIIYNHFFTGRPTAIELMWYVEPEHRDPWTAIALLRAAQRFAKQMGAEKMQFTAPTDQVAQMYEMLGYQKLEVAYQRSL